MSFSGARRAWHTLAPVRDGHRERVKPVDVGKGAYREAAPSLSKETTWTWGRNPGRMRHI